MKKKKILIVSLALLGVMPFIFGCNNTTIEDEEELISTVPTVSFIVTDAMQSKCYDNLGNVIDAPKKGEDYYGQDAQYQGILPSYTDNGDGTVKDNNTGLVWQQTPPKDKMSYDEAKEYVEELELGEYTDWRLPTIKESFSIAMLDGKLNAQDTSLAIPYINSIFDFTYDEMKPYTGSYWTSTVCKMPSTNDYEDMEKNYGFNWADGHLKSYGDGYNIDGTSTGFSIPAGVRAVRGEENIYGVNDFEDNDDGTIIDKATELMWTQQDSGAINDDGTIRLESDYNFGMGRTWTATLAWVEEMNSVKYLGYNDWRLPDIKELQSIVQYEKIVIPATDSDYFNLSRPDCYIWSSTTCGDFPEMADYIAFGKGYGIDLIADSENEMIGPPPGQAPDADLSEMPRPEIKKSDSDTNVSVTTTVDDFADVHGPGCMRADYKDTASQTTVNNITYTLSQVPSLSRQKWETIYLVDYPYPYNDDTFTEFDLSFSENAADYIVIYNYALLVRNAE